MCLITVNSTVDKSLEGLSTKDRTMIEERLYRFADAANANTRGPFENPSNGIRHLPDDLTHIRKVRIGRHRAYYTGHHTQCSYQLVHVKVYKKSDKDKEGSPRFQKKLRRALDATTTRVLQIPDKTSR